MKGVPMSQLRKQCSQVYSFKNCNLEELYKSLSKSIESGKKIKDMDIINLEEVDRVLKNIDEFYNLPEIEKLRKFASKTKGIKQNQLMFNDNQQNFFDINTENNRFSLQKNDSNNNTPLQKKDSNNNNPFQKKKDSNNNNPLKKKDSNNNTPFQKKDSNSNSPLSLEKEKPMISIFRNFFLEEKGNLEIKNLEVNILIFRKITS